MSDFVLAWETFQAGRACGKTDRTALDEVTLMLRAYNLGAIDAQHYASYVENYRRQVAETAPQPPPSSSSEQPSLTACACAAKGGQDKV